MTSKKEQGPEHRKTDRSAGRWLASPAGRQVMLSGTIIVAIVAILALVIVSPLALRELSSLRSVHWAQLSNIGQTYGAASALLTGLALIGVAGSIVFQVRAIQVSREQVFREQHAHLIEMALADPLYQRAWGGLHENYSSPERYRQHGYVNLIISFWQAQYELGAIQDDSLRISIALLFNGEAGRDFWADTRDLRLPSAKSRRIERFYYLIEEGYRKAIIAGPPVVRAEDPSSELVVGQNLALRSSVVKEASALLLGAAGGIFIGSFMRRRR